MRGLPRHHRNQGEELIPPYPDSENIDEGIQNQWFTKLALRGAYNLVRMAKAEWKSSFRSHFGNFEYRVMPYGLTNAPATLQHFINDILWKYLDIFCTAYINDILLYSDTIEEQRLHVPTCCNP